MTDDHTCDLREPWRAEAHPCKACEAARARKARLSEVRNMLQPATE